MGRWRPPRPKSSPYITLDGYRSLEDELKGLWERRGVVTKALAAAAAEGDRSENTEYIYRKKELRQIDYRIRYLQKRLPILKVISTVPDDREKIYFGAWVTLENEQGEEVVYRIVGPDELIKNTYISIDSPLAKVLLKKTFDDEVNVKTEHGFKSFLIQDIQYLTDEHI
jgi:transcription elongation factor GreB